MFTMTNVSSKAVALKLFTGIEKFEVMAVPFFIFAGDLMGRGGVSQRLVRWVMAMLGGIIGFWFGSRNWNKK